MTASAASVNLSLRHVFGVNTEVTDNLSFTDDETIVYVAGHSIVLYHFGEKRQRFLQSSEIADCITAYTSGPGKRLAAVAERGEKPTIHVFDLRTFRRKKTLTTSDLQTKKIICLQFSEDNNLLLALTDAPDWTLMVWNWQRAKLVASITASLSGSPLYKCMFSPLDASVITVIGRDCVKFFRCGEKELRPLQENSMPGNDFKAFCWMRNPDDHLLVGSDEGKIMLFRSGEFMTSLPCAPGSSYPISSLTSVIGGFIAGSTQGSFFIFSYDESKDQALFDSQFRLINVVTASELSPERVIVMAVCPKDERICSLTSDGQLLLMPATSVHTLTAEHVKHAHTPMHSPTKITGLDVALKKPLILTCSKDGSLRLWNYKNHTLELCKTQIVEEMFSCALHPTGLHCAVGFVDKLRCYHVLVGEFRQCMEVPIKACREVRFANGGHFLAAANGNAVAVYDFTTGEKVADLRGHNSKVQAIHWLPSGAHLLTCGMEGAVYLWSLDGAKRIGEWVLKGAQYTSVTASLSSVLVVGNDRSLRELTLPDLAGSKQLDAGLVLTHAALAINKSTLFATTYEHNKPGFVRAYSYPLSTEFDDYACTNANISRMRVTYDENFLVVVDDSGCVCLFEIRGRQDRYARTNPSAFVELLTNPEWSDEVLVTRGELDEYAVQVSELQTRVRELVTNAEYKLSMLASNNATALAEAMNKFKQDLEIAKAKYLTLQEVRVDYEIESMEKIKYMEEMHQNQVQSNETGFQAQIMELVDKYQRLVRERDAQIERLDEHRRLLVEKHEQSVQALTDESEAKLAENQKSRLKEEDEKVELERELLEIQDQLEDDIDAEIDNMKRRYELQLQQDREATMKFKQDNGTLKKKCAMLQRAIEDAGEEYKALDIRDKELMQQSALLKKEADAHKNEIRARDATIFEKEKRVSELKKKNQELDKFKFVLDFKIRELKQQIEPRQVQIADMRKKIKILDEELEQYHKSNAQLDALIGDLRQKIDIMQSDAKNKRMNAKQLENTIATCRSEVQAAMNLIQTPSELLLAVQKIVSKYGSAELVKPRVDPEVEAEYNRHREYLQKSIAELKTSLEAGSAHHMQVNGAVRQKNMSLIAEINAQREANRQLKNSVQAEIGRIRHLLTNMANVKRKQTKGSSIRSHDESGSLKNSATLPVDHVNAAAVANANTMDMLGASRNNNQDPNEFLEPSELLLRNQRRVAALRQLLDDLQSRGPTLLTQVLPSTLQQQQGMMTASGNMLPPIDSSNPANGNGNRSRPRSGMNSSHNIVSLPPLSNRASRTALDIVSSGAALEEDEPEQQLLGPNDDNNHLLLHSEVMEGAPPLALEG